MAVSGDVPDNEAFYDAEVAPGLARLGQACQDRGMAFVAAVEYAPGQLAQTATLPEGSGVGARIVDLAVRARGNVDVLVMALMRHGREHGHGSVCLKLLDGHFDSNGRKSPSRHRAAGSASDAEIGEALARRMEPAAWAAYDAGEGLCTEAEGAAVLASLDRAKALLPAIMRAGPDRLRLYEALSSDSG